MVKTINMYIMMKKNSYLSLVIGGIMSIGLISCSDDSQDADSEGLSVVVFSPTQAVPGETVTIVGSGLDKVEAVTFLNDNRVTDIQVINENQIKVKLPSSLEEVSGKVTVEAGGEAVTAGLDIEIVNPSITAYTPLEVQANNELELSGKYLDKIAEIIFPGNNVVKAIDFIRKSGNVLRVYVPENVPTCSESITLVTTGGQNLISSVMNFKERPAGEWVDKETTIWDGSGSPIDLDWSDESRRLHILSEWFTGEVKQGDKITLHFNLTGGRAHDVKVYGDDSWVNLTEINDIYNTGDPNAARDVTGMTSLTFDVKASYLSYFTKAQAFHIIGSGVQLYKVTWTHKVWQVN